MFYGIDKNITIKIYQLKSRTKILLNNCHFYNKYRKCSNDIEKAKSKGYYIGK